MKPRTLIYRGVGVSAGARQLAGAMQAKTIRRQGSKYRARATDAIINWGRSSIPEAYQKAKVINKPKAVAKAIDKLASFRAFEEYGVPCPAWTTELGTALDWHTRGRVLGRHTRTGRAGEGIAVYHAPTRPLVEERGDEPVLPTLFTRYFRSRREYRVHVAGGRVIDTQQKRVRLDFAGDVDYEVRTHGRGWVFCREAVELDEGAQQAAVAAVDALGLDFGAVDLRVSDKSGPCVLEVNTAPGLEGQTLQSYAEAMRQLVSS